MSDSIDRDIARLAYLIGRKIQSSKDILEVSKLNGALLVLNQAQATKEEVQSRKLLEQARKMSKQ